jgi:hypothetical protein
MKKDTVKLDLETYNNLRDFETTINDDGFIEIDIVTNGYMNGSYVTYKKTSSYKFMTISEGHEKFIEINKELSEANTEMLTSIEKLEGILKANNIDKNTLTPSFNETNKAVLETKQDLSKKSLWEFFKWKKNFKKKNNER